MPENGFRDLDNTALLEHLGVSPSEGLSDEEVVRSRAEHGENRLVAAKRPSLLHLVLEGVREPMVMILLVAVLITTGLNVYKAFSGMHAEFAETVGILVAVSLSIAIKVVMEGRSNRAFEALNAMSETTPAKVVRNGRIEQIPKTDVVVGDIIKVQTGDQVPADARLLESLELAADESMLTGESLPAEKDAGASPGDHDTPLAERDNTIFSGTFVSYGHATAVVTAVGENTEMGDIAEQLKNKVDKSTPLQEKLASLARLIAILGVTASASVFAYEIFKIYSAGAMTFDAVQEAFMVSVALIVAAVPEGLPTIVAITLAMNVLKMASAKALVRKMAASETIGGVSVVCSDKTGTLTYNRMKVAGLYDGAGPIDPNKIGEFLAYNFAVNSTADIREEEGGVKFFGNPTECALLEALGRAGGDMAAYERIRRQADVARQFPFSSDRKSMVTIVRTAGGKIAYSKGSPEKILGICDRVSTPDGAKPIGEAAPGIAEAIKSLQGEGKRVLAFAHDTVSDGEAELQDATESTMIFDGYAAIADPLRDDVGEAVERCFGAGIEVKMLTGDSAPTATSIARELGLLREGFVVEEAKDIDALSDDELERRLPRIAVIARSMPLTKMRVVKALRKMGEVVAVTGDGINDAPALKNADVGIAMGVTGTEVSKEASDIILLDDSFSTIVKAIEWGRAIYENFQRFMQFQLTVNLVAVITVIACEVLGLPVPFTTLQLLWINIIMDGPPALSLGLEALRPSLMERPPVPRNARIITGAMLLNIVSNGLFIVAMMLLLINTNVLGGTAEEQPAIFFTVFVLFQLFNAFNSRELGAGSMFKNVLNNVNMLWIVGVTFVLQVLITEFGGELFRSAPLTPEMWLKMVAFASSVVLFSEGVRLVRRLRAA